MTAAAATTATAPTADVAPVPVPDRPAVHDLRLVPAAAVAWAGAALAVGLPTGVALVLAGVLLGAALLGLRPRRPTRRRTRRPPGGPGGPAAARWSAVLALAAVAGSAAVASGALQVAQARSGLVADLAGDRAVVEVQARVAAEPSRVRPPPGAVARGERWVVRVHVAEVTGRGLVGGARAGVLAVGGAGLAALRRDEEVVLVGRLEPLPAGDDLLALLRVQAPPHAVTPPTGWRGAAADLRGGLHAAVAAQPPDRRGLLPGLVVGDTSRLPEDLEDEMRTTGLAHLTAVSGGNTAVLVAAVAGGAAVLGAGRRVRTGAALTALVAFVGVAGPEPSVLRAGVMAAAALVGLLAGRPGRGVPLLAVAVVVLVVADPASARSPGLALSVLGTGALLVLARPWAQALEGGLPRRLAAALAVPAAAQVVCAPVLLLLAPELSLAAVPANLLAAPAVAPATVLGVVALALAPASPALAELVAVPAGWAVGWVALVARTGAGVPGAAVPFPGGWAGAALLAGLLLLGLVAVPALVRVVVERARAARARARRRATGRRGAGPRAVRPGPGWSRAVAALAGAAVLLLVAVVGLPRWRSAGSWPPAGWAAVQCDVGQGAALAVRSGEEAAVVVDAGPDPGAVRRCLDRLGVERVDLLVLTHFHADHVDGLGGVLEGREVTAALVSPLAEPAPAAAASARLLDEAGVPVAAGTAGLAGRAGDVAWRVLWPSAGAPGGSPSGAAPGGEDDGANDASVVVTLTRGDGLRVTALGDLGAEAQASLRRRTADDAAAWPVDVLGVAHHGSADQDPDLAALAAPRAALVGVGENTYGHPSDRALALAGAGGAVVACTTVTGDVAVATAGAGELVVVPRRRVPASGPC
ncbi:ComEC/Rec2 family competence protein [Pseudokineococcus lusitanus]|uniref:Competence protein ComEC n=1 Tax=Pseudokineococcus lusitanus TaxID=763993 RepID=A0A3N1HTT3_9ACTN|nr:ComEC/Rec2 family competence protein [Pseudokineococcus lusitanus]ROP45830.1 competence protein ComEC [Pseudokineococcus lusitanus]